MTVAAQPNPTGSSTTRPGDTPARVPLLQGTEQPRRDVFAPTDASVNGDDVRNRAEGVGAAETLQGYAARVVSQAPTLTREQRDKLRLLLQSSPSREGSSDA